MAEIRLYVKGIVVGRLGAITLIGLIREGEAMTVRVEKHFLFTTASER